MKKIIYTLLTILGALVQAQVVVGGGDTTLNGTLSQEDLDIQGNLKVEAIESLCDEVDNNVVCEPYSPTFLDTEDNNTVVKGNIPKIFQRLVFYIKVGEKEDRIVRFDTKIDSKKYAALLSGGGILNETGKPFLLPSITSGLNATKEIKLFESEDTDSPTWLISANYSSNVPNSIWKVELLLMDKSYVTSIEDANPNAIYDTKATDVARIKTQGGVGVGEKEPKANLDVKGKLRIKTATDVTKDGDLKDRTLPLVVDISSDSNGDKTDSWGMLKATGNPNAAYPIQLHINMEGSRGDFLYFLRLGLDPKKYTPVLANYQLNCKHNNNWGITLKGGKQPTPNSYVTRWKDESNNHTYATGEDDWALYLDFVDGDPKGCVGDTYWDAFLLVFRNENIISIPVINSDKENTVENPFDISKKYDETLKGYIGGVDASPLP